MKTILALIASLPVIRKYFIVNYEYFHSKQQQEEEEDLKRMRKLYKEIKS